MDTILPAYSIDATQK